MSPDARSANVAAEVRKARDALRAAEAGPSTTTAT